MNSLNKDKDNKEKIYTKDDENNDVDVEQKEKTVQKFLNGKPYEQEDITNSAKITFLQFEQSFKKQFKLVSISDDLDKIFENNILEENKPLFIIFEKLKLCWVLCCIIKTKNNKIRILFKDSSGEKMPYRIEKELKEVFSEAEVISNLEEEHDTEEKENYGYFCLYNLDILLNLIREDINNIEEKFLELKFFKRKDLDNEKIKIVLEKAQEFLPKNEFKVALKKFIDQLPLELGSKMLNYKKILEEELNKDEKDIDHKKIEEARKHYLNENDINKLKENYKKNNENTEFEIQKEFSQEIEKLGNIFNTLHTIIDKTQLNSALEKISEILLIDYEKLKSFYDVKQKEEKKEKPKLTPDDIKSIADNLPPMEKPKLETTTPFEEILSEITLGNDQNDFSPSQHTHQNNKTQLEQDFYLIKSHYARWKWSQLEDIHSWAISKKGKLGNNIDKICEVIAVADRAFTLLTGGQRLRDTQILSILIFFEGHTKQGRLCQIQTGEGKTVIISILALIKALQGHTVDVITSSPVLATEGVEATRNFYSVFGLTVGSNNSEENFFKIGYTADVLYGSISNFQFDYLKENFEGLIVRKERRFEFVILDEVDSLLMDNGANIAKIATPYPGMEYLRYVFIKIWQELYNAEKNFVEENKKKVIEILANPNKNEIKENYENFIEKIALTERKIIKSKILESKPSEIFLIPQHLKQYVADNLENWIDSALHAKYDYHEYQQYKIIKNTDNEEIIAPVDNLNTGITLKNTVWSKGLHQFLQLKHNLQLTCNTLSSIFISNIGYIKCYPNQNIFGVTGTLGSTNEQNFLSTIYNVNFSKMPTFKRKHFEELPGIVSSDDSWDIEVTAEIVKKIDEGRAVLTIFETEKDLLDVKKNLEIIQSNDFKIRIFSNEDNVSETKHTIQIGDIILATNLAGRGTNFKTNKQLEKNGGLHVFIGFLPCNIRVEEQAFGRTSRQGNKGSGQLIVRQSEILLLDLDKNSNFNEIKYKRNLIEKQRLEKISQVLIEEINFKEKLVELFSKLYLKLKWMKVLSKEYSYVLHDLKEFWAFWLDKKKFNINNIQETTPQKQFDEFLSNARNIIEGTISHNPFYSIGLADYYLEKNKKSSALRELNHALSLSGENTELLAGAHLKLFEVAIGSGNQTWEKVKKAIAKVFFINVQKNSQYKKNALLQLEKAKTFIKKEIDYLENFLDQKIIQEKSKNKFLQQIHSRLYCLNIHDGNIKELIDFINAEDSGIDFNGKAETNLNNFQKMSEETENYVSKNELNELKSVGIDSLYSLRYVKDVPDYVIHVAQGQIIGGIAALAAGLVFPPILPFMSSLGVTLITEGIIDIVFALIGDSPEVKDLIKDKAISYGVSLVTFGISAIAQSIKILTKALSIFRKLSSFLKKSKYLKGLCTKLAGYVDNIANKIEDLLKVAKFNKLTKAEQLDELTKLKESGQFDAFNHLGGTKQLEKLQKLQKFGKLRELTRTELAAKFAKNIAIETGKKVATKLIQDYVIKPLVEKCFKKLIELLKNTFKNSLKKSIQENKNLLEKIRITPSDQIDKILDKFIEGNKIYETIKKVVFDVLGNIDNSAIEILTHVYDTASNGIKIGRICTKFTTYLSENLPGGSSNNDTNEIIEKICSKLADELLDLTWGVLKDNAKFAWKHRNIFSANKLPKTDIVVSEKPDEKQQTSKMENTWEIFGLKPTTSVIEVKKHYRKMALLLHPDKNLNDPSAEEKFKKLGNAYQEILKNLDSTEKV